MKAAAPAAVLTELPGVKVISFGGGLTISGQMPSDDPKSGFLVTPQKIPCSNAQGISL
jgi:hypothetical protein